MGAGLMRGWTTWAAISLAALTLLLVLSNVALAMLNQRLQNEASARQQFLLTESEYRRVGEALVHSLNNAAASTKDPQLLALMQRHGITPAPAAAAPPGRSK